MNTFPILLGALCVYALAYRYYSAFIAAKALMLDDSRATPAHKFRDGHNYVASPKWVLFGHHFAAIAGAGPLVGPTLAAQFGFAPGFLWLLVGAVLAGCVQDFTVLVASIRHKGRSLAEIARTEISPFRLGIRGHGLVSADELMSLLEAPAFRAMADLLPDPLIAVDTHENVTFLNSAMERLSGISATAAERLPFGRFLRRAGWSLEETSGNRTDGRARLFLAKEQSTLPVLRRILPAHEGAEGYTVYIIRPGEAPDAPPVPPNRQTTPRHCCFRIRSKSRSAVPPAPIAAVCAFCCWVNPASARPP